MEIIDIHTHGIGGYDTRLTAVDHIFRIAEMHGSQGVSEILLAIYPSAIRTMRENMEAVKKAMELQTGAGSPSKITGLYLEGPFLNPYMSGALDANAFIEPNDYNVEELIDGYQDIIKVIAVAPEIKGALALIKKISDLGIIVTMGHSDATYDEAEAGFHAGARGITHIFNAMRGLHHREPGIAGFGLLNRDIYIEVIADPYHLHMKTIELIFGMKNPEKIIIISDTVKESGLSFEKREIADGKGGLIGGCMTVAESSKRIIQMGFDEDIITGCITRNPERYLSGK